jgi:hypothetical protein
MIVHNSVEAKEPAPALAWSRSAPQASPELRLGSSKSRRLNMNTEVESKMVLRRRILPFLGLAAVAGLALRSTAAKA